MKKKIGFLSSLLFITALAVAQVQYDSITISRSRIEQRWFSGKWIDTLKADRYSAYIFHERTIWKKEIDSRKTPAIMGTVNRIKKNGEGDITKCFIPRHSVNFYKQGKIVRFLLVCFECSGLRLSDGPFDDSVKNVGTREKQMKELKTYFKELL